MGEFGRGLGWNMSLVGDRGALRRGKGSGRSRECRGQKKLPKVSGVLKEAVEGEGRWKVGSGTHHT